MKNFYVEPCVEVVNLETEAVMLEGSETAGNVVIPDVPLDGTNQQHEIWGGSLEDIWK